MISLYNLYKSKITDSSNVSLKDFFIAKQIEAVRDAYYFNYLKYLPISKGGNVYKTSSFRDSIMSENILSLMKRYPGKRIIIWAHNEHIKKGSSMKEKNVTMGNYLSEKLKDQYKSYCFTSATGIATGYGQYGQPKVYSLLEPTPDTYEFYLNKTGSNIAFWNLALPGNELLNEETIVSKLKLRSIGYNYIDGNQFTPEDLAHNYNGLFFINNTTNSKSFHFHQN